MNILWIEPDVILARQYQKLVVEAGHSLNLCLDPQVAIDIIDRLIPAVIVMEVQLVPLSGLAFLHELRSHEDLADIPVIIYSSVPKESFGADDRSWRDLGVIKYLYKSKHSIATVIQNAEANVNANK